MINTFVQGINPTIPQLGRSSIANFVISTGSYTHFIQLIINLSFSRSSSYVCVANVHMLIEAYRSNAFAQEVNSADIVTPDGAPLALGLKWLYGTQQDRVAGMDLMPSLLAEAEKQGLKVFLFGSTPEVLAGVQGRCVNDYPKLSIAGSFSPPFRPLTSKEEEQIVNQINSSGAHMVFVALGCPKQERWMASMKGRVNAVMIGLGGAFPVFAGLQSRAPRWMQRASLEWLYRLIQEPGRLWKRYLVTNTLFILLLIREWWRVRVLHKSELIN